jgi:hypothetical protein
LTFGWIKIGLAILQTLQMRYWLRCLILFPLLAWAKNDTPTQLAKQALMRAQWSQKVLSETIGCSRQPVTNFFNGKAIEQTIFIRVCDRLGLDWQAIAGFAQAPDDGATPANRNRAVVWSAGTVDAGGNPYTTVTRLDGRNSASTSSLARDINDAGLVTGRMALSATFGDETGFVHRPGDTALTSLGLFGTTRTEALDIGENGWIVGYAGATEGDSSNNSRALVWFPQVGGVGGYQAFELLSLPDSSDPANGGWTKLLEARQVSADGTIAGYGRYVATPGGVEVTRGFVLTARPTLRITWTKRP